MLIPASYPGYPGYPAAPPLTQLSSYFACFPWACM